MNNFPHFPQFSHTITHKVVVAIEHSYLTVYVDGFGWLELDPDTINFGGENFPNIYEAQQSLDLVGRIAALLRSQLPVSVTLETDRILDRPHNCDPWCDAVQKACEDMERDIRKTIENVQPYNYDGELQLPPIHHHTMVEFDIVTNYFIAETRHG